MFNTKLRQHLLPYHRRLLCEALEARTLLSVGLPQAPVGDAVQASSAAQPQTLADLPVAAQHVISSAIGQDKAGLRKIDAATVRWFIPFLFHSFIPKGCQQLAPGSRSAPGDSIAS